MAIGSDLTLPQVQGPRPLTVRLINAYIHRLLVAAEHDPIIATRFLRVSAFLDKPPRLVTPPIIARVISGNRRVHRPTPTTQPEIPRVPALLGPHDVRLAGAPVEAGVAEA
jgi:hypothetical protein